VVIGTNWVGIEKMIMKLCVGIGIGSRGGGNLGVIFLVGNLSAIDADTTDTFTFSLENDTGK
jgi:hypothetical protein